MICHISRMNVLIYCRISTLSQSVVSQEDMLLDLCNVRGWNVYRIISEQGSGMNDNRNGLKEMKLELKSGDIDLIVCSELSRISRNKDFMIRFIGRLRDMDIDIFVMSRNKFLSDMDEEELMSVLDYANSEVSELRSRMFRGYSFFRENGGKVGRKVGFRKPVSRTVVENPDVRKLLLSGFSVREVMRLTDKSSGLVMKVRKVLKEMNLIK